MGKRPFFVVFFGEGVALAAGASGALVNLPIKEFNNGHPEFNFKLHELVKSSIPKFTELQSDYQKYLEDHIKSLI